jgi:hypothetical protein
MLRSAVTVVRRSSCISIGTPTTGAKRRRRWQPRRAPCEPSMLIGRPTTTISTSSRTMRAISASTSWRPSAPAP